MILETGKLDSEVLKKIVFGKIGAFSGEISPFLGESVLFLGGERYVQKKL